MMGPQEVKDPLVLQELMVKMEALVLLVALVLQGHLE